MEIGLFDVLGPIMVGPSSSHTAGAVRLGNIARKIAGTRITQAEFYLHGSFASTYQGHGTDKALLGGVLGLAPDDENIKDSFSLAGAAGIQYFFRQDDLGDVHPNSVRIVLKTDDKKDCELTGSSIGGGKVKVNSLNGMHVEFSGQYPTIITIHNDLPGVVANVSSVLSRHEINIAFLRVFRQLKGSQACMVIESDQPISDRVLGELEKILEIHTVTLVNL